VDAKSSTPGFNRRRKTVKKYHGTIRIRRKTLKKYHVSPLVPLLECSVGLIFISAEALRLNTTLTWLNLWAMPWERALP